MKKEEKNDAELEVKEQKAEKPDIKKELSAAKKALAEAEKEAKAAKDKEAESTDKMLRLAAEYDNFRKRAVKEKEDAYTDAYVDIVKELLPVMDNLERAKAFSDAEDTGTALIMKQLSDVFSKLGVEEIPADGVKFDPNVHNAVMMDADTDAEEGTVTAVLQKGYTVRGKVIRFAMVKVKQ